jgi:hypothetical protein
LLYLSFLIQWKVNGSVCFDLGLLQIVSWLVFVSLDQFRNCFHYCLLDVFGNIFNWTWLAQLQMYCMLLAWFYQGVLVLDHEVQVAFISYLLVFLLNEIRNLFHVERKNYKIFGQHSFDKLFWNLENLPIAQNQYSVAWDFLLELLIVFPFINEFIVLFEQNCFIH